MINDLAHYALEIYITTFFVQILLYQQNDKKKDHNRTRNTRVERRKSATH